MNVTFAKPKNIAKSQILLLLYINPIIKIILTTNTSH